jgi:hypothetical protein
VNDCIASLISAWKIYDKSSLLDLIRSSEELDRRGTASELDTPASGAGPRESTGDASSYLQQIEKQMEQLAEMIKANNAKQEEIRSLRDGVSLASPTAMPLPVFVCSQAF